MPVLPIHKIGSNVTEIPRFLTLNSLRQKVIEVSFEMTNESNSSDNRKISVEIDRLSA